jgi:hypothetical protein
MIRADDPVDESFRCGTPGEIKAAPGLSSEDVKVRTVRDKGLFDPITVLVASVYLQLPEPPHHRRHVSHYSTV